MSQGLQPAAQHRPSASEPVVNASACNIYVDCVTQLCKAPRLDAPLSTHPGVHVPAFPGLGGQRQGQSNLCQRRLCVQETHHNKRCKQW